MDKFTMILAQVNVVVGDISGNATRIIDICSQAKAKFDSEFVVFPELALTGYPPEDLLFRGDFIRKAENELTQSVLDSIPEKEIDQRVFSSRHETVKEKSFWSTYKSCVRVKEC